MFHNHKKYNCPVKLWLGLDYPSSPPTCYVVPTRDMGIKPRHVHVDNSGFIYHGYLTQWNVRSSLKELCTTLTTVFSKDPPVFAKPAAGRASSHTPAQGQQTSSTPQPPAPQPQHSRPAPSQPERPPAPVASPPHRQPPPPPAAAVPAQPPAGGSWPSTSTAYATGPAAAAVEEESKESLVLFVMSKINVSRPALPCRTLRMACLCSNEPEPREQRIHEAPTRPRARNDASAHYIVVCHSWQVPAQARNKNRERKKSKLTPSPCMHKHTMPRRQGMRTSGEPTMPNSTTTRQRKPISRSRSR